MPPQAAASIAGLQRLLTTVRSDVRQADQAVTPTAAQDPIAVALQQISGIGPILAVLIRAEVGEMRRFPTTGHLASYAGLVPSVDNSARRIRYGRITRRGSPWLRWALVEAAIPGVRRTDDIGRWGRRLALRKGALKARIALARVRCADVYRAWPTA